MSLVRIMQVDFLPFRLLLLCVISPLFVSFMEIGDQCGIQDGIFMKEEIVK